jgi:signal transduction histidine kinase
MRLKQNSPVHWFLASLVALPLAAFGAPDIVNHSAGPSPSVLDQFNHLGSWIWDVETFDKQTCRMWRAFEVPENVGVVRAQLRVSADNGYRLFLDGLEIGQGSDWRTLTVYDVTWRLTPGAHVLAVEAFNDADKAGVIAGLQADLTDGRTLEIASDRNWRIVPNTARRWQNKKRADPSWPKAKVVGRLGQEPWWSRPIKTIDAPPLLPVSVHFWQSAWLQIGLVLVSIAAAATSLRLMTKLAIQSKAQSLLQLERARIARDIHDDLGARLTQLLLAGEVAQSKLPAGSDTRLQFDQICENAREVLDAIDEVVWVVNSQRDTLGDFVNYVCKYAQSFLRSTSVRGRFDVEKDLPAVMLDLPIRRNLLLAVKEAVSNAARHSEATEMFVRIRREGPALTVVVEDNGKGFDPVQANAERNGLTNMAQRMEELGGDCQINSRPGSGCRVEFKIPLAQLQSARRRFRWPFRAKAATAQSASQRILATHSPTNLT